MSSRPVAISTEWSAEEECVVVVVDAQMSDDEPKEIEDEIKKARDDGDEEPWWFSYALDPSEAELLGREMVRHAMIATVLNDLSVAGEFTWEEESEPGVVLRIDLSKGSEPSLSAIREAVYIDFECGDCERRFGLEQLCATSFADLELRMRDEGWKLEEKLCDRCEQ